MTTTTLPVTILLNLDPAAASRAKEAADASRH